MVDDYMGLPMHSNIRMGGSGVGVVEYGSAQNKLVQFYWKAVHHPAKSQAAGCPVYEDHVYVKIQEPGERLTQIDRPVRPEDKRVWAIQWNQFQQNQDQLPDGTPIGLLYPEKPSVVHMLAAHGVHTVQQLANLSANAIDTIGMGAQHYVNDAQKYIKSAEAGAGTVQLRKEIEAKDRDIKILRSQLESLKNEVDRLSAQAAGATVNLSQAQLQDLIAGRSLHPTMPINPQTSNFDPATAQINATSPRAMPPKPKRVKL